MSKLTQFPTREVDKTLDLGETKLTHRPIPKWNKSAIASLSPVEITHLSCEELAEIIEEAGYLLPQPIDPARLRACNREILERLAHLARQCCRNRGY